MALSVQKQQKSSQIRKQLKHPVIDVDGHLVEYRAPIEDYVREIGGTSLRVRFPPAINRIYSKEDLTFRATRRPGVWWPYPTRNTLDRATAALPKLLYERMDDMGLDYTILFPSIGVPSIHLYREGSDPGTIGLDQEMETIKWRAINTYRADLCREYSDRMTPVARISMIDPKAAISEAEFAVKVLGLKALYCRAERRPIPEIHKVRPDLFPAAYWLDTLGIDSAYNYDPFWAKCAELMVPILFHQGGFGLTDHNSPSNAVYNHINHTACGGEAVLKSLFLGGVTHRFPTLKFAFLECGIVWGCRVFRDLVDRWEKRGPEGIQNTNPAHLDRDLFVKLHEQYGNDRIRKRLSDVLTLSENVNAEPIEDSSLLNDFAKSGVQRIEDIRELFVDRFFFGCEADDPFTSMAYNRKLLPFGAKLNPVLSSDIGHWDVPDTSRVLEEAYELVERGLLTEEDLQDFLFTSPVKLLAGANPEFFKGTVVESAVNRAMGHFSRGLM